MAINYELIEVLQKGSRVTKTLLRKDNGWTDLQVYGLKHHLPVLVILTSTTPYSYYRLVTYNLESVPQILELLNQLRDQSKIINRLENKEVDDENVIHINLKDKVKALQKAWCRYAREKEYQDHIKNLKHKVAAKEIISLTSRKDNAQTRIEFAQKEVDKTLLEINTLKTTWIQTQ